MRRRDGDRAREVAVAAMRGGMSAEDVARACGVSTTTVLLLVRGGYPWTANSRRIAEAAGTLAGMADRKGARR